MDLIFWRADHDELAVGCETGREPSHGLATGSCRKNRPGSAHTLQLRCDVPGGSVDVHVCAQIFRQLFLVVSASDSHSSESHVPGKLDAKMIKAANALNSDQVSGSQTRVAKRVEGCGCENWRI